MSITQETFHSNGFTKNSVLNSHWSWWRSM